MAESVLSVFLTVLFEKLASEALNKIARAKGIDSELQKLKRSLDRIQALLNDASRKEITDEAVKIWLNDLQHLAYDIDDVLDELATEDMERELKKESGATTSMVRKLIPTCCIKFSLSTRMNAKLDDIATKLQELLEGKSNPGLSVITNEKPRVEGKRYEASLVDASGIVGRDADKKALLQKLLGGKDESCKQNFSIVPIVGMGGIGKTSLARLLYDEKEVKDHFELRAWVCVSNEFSIPNISTIIYQSVTGENKEFADLNMLQEALKEKLTKKLFLVVLDDVWCESDEDWDKLVGPFVAGAHGSKVIMTTRKERLLRKLGYTDLDPLQSLSHNDAVSLFAQNALGVDNFDMYPTLRPYGEGIVKKSGGLPLALKALGRLLRTKTNEEEWKELLNSEIWSLGNTDEIVPALKLSYNDLSASLKRLFAYCSLFPKDYVFDKEDLILLWMAEGFLHQTTTNKSMARLGLECFEELFSRSFFQHSPEDKLFTMHDLMHDLARAIAGEFFSMVDIEMKKEFRKEASQKYRHISFVCQDFMVYRSFQSFEGAKNVRTFLALTSVSRSHVFLSNKILADLLQELPLLRVLSLSRLSISNVESIGILKHLRYLNLSETRISVLPESVCKLYNLQTLIVSGCRMLEKLPKNFSKLKNLQHFDMRDTPLVKKMPLGIGELKSLRTLSKIIIEGDNGFSINELKDLKDLQGRISFKGLEKVQSPMHAQEANLSQKRVSELEVEWNNVFDGSRKETLEKLVLNVLKPHNDNLKKLGIVSYGGTEFPNWVGEPLFLLLADVSIHGCKKCTSLPLLGQLPSLKVLSIKGMDAVKVVGSELFPSLKVLSFEDMQGWEIWSTNNNGVEDAAFPCLQKLSVESCPNLVQVSVEALPSLKVLELRKCGDGVLTSLLHVAPSVTKLKIDDISGLTDEVWRGVIQYLGAVKEVSIRRCNEIRYMWESEAEASKFLVNLMILDVGFCSKLVSLSEKEGEDNCGSNLTSLAGLYVDSCKSLEHCSFPNAIEYLIISNCDLVTSVSFPTGGGQNLKSVRIDGGKELLEKEFGGEKTGLLINSSMRMLEAVYIEGWPNLKSITELGCFIHLTKLLIMDCPSIESFPDHELSNLAVLEGLIIRNCQNMDASFSSGFWPPKLRGLGIGGLKKPLSEWGPQNFPTSLVDLILWGGPNDDVRNIGQLSHLLPPTLTSLDIDEFEKLESLSMVPQHLTSLKHLGISRCPKTKDLPEMLLSSLFSLRIIGCPNITKRMSRRGSYWPLISCIPCVELDGRLQT